MQVRLRVALKNRNHGFLLLARVMFFGLNQDPMNQFRFEEHEQPGIKKITYTSYFDQKTKKTFWYGSLSSKTWKITT